MRFGNKVYSVNRLAVSFGRRKAAFSVVPQGLSDVRKEDVCAICDDVEKSNQKMCMLHNSTTWGSLEKKPAKFNFWVIEIYQ